MLRDKIPWIHQHVARNSFFRFYATFSLSTWFPKLKLVHILKRTSSKTAIKSAFSSSLRLETVFQQKIVYLAIYRSMKYIYNISSSSGDLLKSERRKKVVYNFKLKNKRRLGDICKVTSKVSELKSVKNRCEGVFFIEMTHACVSFQ